jgi:hypothetical protein
MIRLTSVPVRCGERSFSILTRDGPCSLVGCQLVVKKSRVCHTHVTFFPFLTDNIVSTVSARKSVPFHSSGDRAAGINAELKGTAVFSKSTTLGQYVIEQGIVIKHIQGTRLFP